MIIPDKRTFTTRLEPEYLDKIKNVLDKQNVLKRELVQNALEEFKKMLIKNGAYHPLYNNFDRLRVTIYTVVTYDEVSKDFEKIAKKLNLSYHQLMREILINYIETYRA